MIERRKGKKKERMNERQKESKKAEETQRGEMNCSMMLRFFAPE